MTFSDLLNQHWDGFCEFCTWAVILWVLFK